MAARKLPEQVLVWEKQLNETGLGHLDVRRALRQVSATEKRLKKFSPNDVQTFVDLTAQMIQSRGSGFEQRTRRLTEKLSQNKYSSIRMAFHDVNRAKQSLPDQVRTILGWA
ncbi:MAG: hypothetical protein AAB492_00430 [Patescibacteria group bacterium]